MELVLSHHESRCVHYQYSYMIVDRRNIPLLPTNYSRLNLFKKYHMQTQQNGLKMNWYLFCWRLWALVYNADNADLSSTHVKDIVHHSSVKHMTGERTTISLWHIEDRPAGLIFKRSTKCTPNFAECLERAFADLIQGFISFKNREFDLQELLWHEHTSHLHLPWVNVEGSTDV